MTPKSNFTRPLSQWNIPLHQKSNPISLRKAKPWYLYSYPIYPHSFQGNLLWMIPSTTFRAKYLAEEVSVIISTLQTRRTRDRREQIIHVCQEDWIDALMLSHSACSSAFPSYSLPPKISFAYLPSSLNLPYLYFIHVFILIQVECVLIYSWTKTFTNVFQTHWDRGHPSVLHISCIQTLCLGPQLELEWSFCDHSVWF